MIPDRLKIGGSWWNVRVANTGDLHGYCHPDQQTIFISDTANEDVARITLIHECLHAMFFVGGIGKRVRFNEEEAIGWLQYVLYGFIKDNKEALDNL
jgi:hypothetical protein